MNAKDIRTSTIPEVTVTLRNGRSITLTNAQVGPDPRALPKDYQGLIIVKIDGSLFGIFERDAVTCCTVTEENID